MRLRRRVRVPEDEPWTQEGNEREMGKLNGRERGGSRKTGGGYKKWNRAGGGTGADWKYVTSWEHREGYEESSDKERESWRQKAR